MGTGYLGSLATSDLKPEERQQRMCAEGARLPSCAPTTFNCGMECGEEAFQQKTHVSSFKEGSLLSRFCIIFKANEAMKFGIKIIIVKCDKCGFTRKRTGREVRNVMSPHGSGRAPGRNHADQAPATGT